MTILDILTKAGVASGQVIALLRQLAESAPDLAEQIDDLIARLESAVAPDNLVALASALPAEILAIAHGEIHPASHPSDGA